MAFSTLFITKAFSLYFLVVGLSMLINSKAFSKRFACLIESESCLLIVAILTLILGIILILFHNIWQGGWNIFISILCWLTFIKGAIRMLFPQFDALWKNVFTKTSSIVLAGFFCLLLGVITGYVGFHV